MTSLNLALKLLEEKLEDLQRDTIFCINSYDYHHKNNELEILQNLQTILRDSLQEGEQFICNMENIRSSIIEARKKCCEIDELLMNQGWNTETSSNTENCAGGSQSFHEQQEENKQNSY